MRTLLIAAFGAFLALPSADRGDGQEQRPVFRGLTDLVSVPVAVDDGNIPVTGLTLDDFELNDNGVRQDIAFIADGSVPIDLTLAVDLGGNPSPQSIAQLREDIGKLDTVLQPADRIRVLTFDFQVNEMIGWSSAAQLPGTFSMVTGGRTTLHDAMLAALLGARTRDRRHLAAVFMRGGDSLSGVDAGRILQAAGHSKVALYTYLVELSRPREYWGKLDSFGNLLSGIRASGELRSFTPLQAAREQYQWDRIAALEAAAEKTGGAARDYKTSALSSLRDLVREFRRSYVLYYYPRDVDDAGWHRLDVAVSRPGANSYTVRSRSGYARSEARAERIQGVEAGGDLSDRHVEVLPKPPPPPRADLEPRLIAAHEIRRLLDSYANGEYQVVVQALRRSADPEDTARSFRREAERWIDESATDRRGRQVAAAALALEVGAPSYPIPNAKRDAYLEWTQVGRTLLVWGAGILGSQREASAVERPWYLAAVAALQGMLQFRGDMRYRNDADKLLKQAMARVPHEPRFRLSRAQAVEQLFDLQRRASRSDVANAFEAAVAQGNDDVTAEIQLRYVVRFLGANMPQEALGPITSDERREDAKQAVAQTLLAERLTHDDFVRYICRFLRARLFDRLDAREQAEASYRSALEVYPQAQSASMPLATLLLLRGEEAAAQSLVDGVLAHPGADDPWRIYFLQDYRRLPMYIEQMRAALQAGR